ncbi:SDR family oxidoreductase [Arabiibacter massiliensis]|uniref:SDR family oxidoreductase n=1 Tax=Arabiibacter massiliensis TaxID=1870985 RepID=UPI0009B99100|nr:SDR family oxidoreductase [Arabiibacter massiliensis]
MRLENESAVITGAGSGMGRAMTELFALEGANIVAADINTDGVETLIAELKEKGAPGTIVPCKTDVSDCSQVEAMIDLAVERFGRLDILVNNAGIMDHMMPVTELSDDLWAKVIDVNLKSVMYACRHAIPLMTAPKDGDRQGGRIVNTASVGGLSGCRAGAAYTASKFGVVGLTRNIGFMYATKGIRCNAICPGSIETNIGVGLSAASEFGMERATSGIGSNPRNGSAEEVAKVALFLASDESSFVNGTTVTVDGGWTAF